MVHQVAALLHFYFFKGCSFFSLNFRIQIYSNSVTSIGDATFYNCSSLTSITIPNSVTSLEFTAFYGCSSLTSITIPNSVTSLGVGTFVSCSGLTSITIPNSVTSIGIDAFYDCSKLTSINTYSNIAGNNINASTNIPSRVTVNVLTNLPKDTAEASASTLTPLIGANNNIILTVKDSAGNVDTTFNGDNQVTISGVSSDSNGLYGTFNGTPLTVASTSGQEVTVTFAAGVATCNLALKNPARQSIEFSIAGVTNPLTNTLNITPIMASPTVTTQGVTSITSTTATGNGNITSVGAPNPTQHGIVWGTSTNPTVDLSSRTEEGPVTSTGAFTSSITGLIANTTYYVRAYATNTVGTAYGSEVTFTTSSTVPDSPTMGTAIAGDTQASITFSAPASNGGSAITGYIVIANPGGATGTGTTSPIIVTGLTNGTPYTFTVAATNSKGTGNASSPSNSVSYKAMQTITFNNPGAQNFGTSPTLTATSTSGLAVTFTSNNLDIATITSGGAITFLKTGNVTINADQAGDSNYLPATTVSQTFSVKAVIPDIPTITLNADATLSNLTINGTSVTAFNSATLIYNVELPAGTSSIPTVVATVTDTGKATAKVTAATALPGTATIVVTAEDGMTTKTYTINFTIATPVSTVSTLLALGDSISYGMSATPGNSYVDLLFNHLKTANTNLTLNNLSVSGYTSSNLLLKLQDPTYIAAIKNAKVITISVGGDNLLSPVIAAVCTGFGVNPSSPTFMSDLATAMASNPNKDVILASIASSPALASGLQAGVTQFGSDLPQIISTLRMNSPQSQIYVLNLYNPFASTDPLYALFDPLINGINANIEMYKTTGGYKVANVYDKFKTTTGAVNFSLSNLQLDPHPTAVGHAAIYQAILDAESGLAYYKVNIGTLTGGSITTSSTTATSGSAITLTITPASGKQLQAGSLKYNVGTQYIPILGTSFIMPAANVTVSATFEDVPANTYTVSIGTLVNGTITASSATATSGSAITLTITPTLGNQLQAGSLKYNDGTQDVVITGTSFTMPERNVTVSAVFEVIPNTTSEGGSSSSGGDSSSNSSGSTPSSTTTPTTTTTTTVTTPAITTPTTISPDNINGTERLAGQSRVDTALAIAKAIYSKKVSNVILATSENYPDALAGSVLAYKLNAPILLIGSSSEDQAKVLDYLENNMDNTGKIYILGGSTVVNTDMETKITALGFSNIIRLAGADRYETAVKIADTIGIKEGTPIVLVAGENYADALSISSVAEVNQYPIFIVGKAGISDLVKNEISTIKPSKVFIIGSQGAVSTTVEDQVSQIGTVDKENIVRIGGTDRFETSLLVAKYFKLTGNIACIATGNDFPDALAGSVYAAKNNAHIILVDKALTESEIEYLQNEKISGATIFGGESVVSMDIEEQLNKILSR